MFTIACCLVVGLRLKLDLVSGLLVVFIVLSVVIVTPCIYSWVLLGLGLEFVSGYWLVSG